MDVYNATSTPNHSLVGIPTSCESCHTTGAWSPTTFEHVVVVGTPCANCHLAVYGTTPFYPDDGSLVTSGGPATFHDWADFPEPPSAYVLHGIWTEDALNEAHFAMQREHQHSWREWVR